MSFADQRTEWSPFSLLLVTVAPPAPLAPRLGDVMGPPFFLEARAPVRCALSPLPLIGVRLLLVKEGRLVQRLRGRVVLVGWHPVAHATLVGRRLKQPFGVQDDLCTFSLQLVTGQLVLVLNLTCVVLLAGRHAARPMTHPLRDAN